MEALTKAFPEFTEKYFGEEEATNYRPFLEPMTSIYLNSDAKYGTGQSGDMETVYLFSAISLLILLIAAVNYMNLSTARSAKRGKEVGIRKLAGGTRQSLIRQFLGEALLITVIAFGLALLLTEISLPYFNQLTWKNFVLSDLLTNGFLLILAGIILFMGFAAGMYPAFYLSAFQPVEVLKGSISSKGQNGMRRFLVVFQFLIASGLIIATLTVYTQLDYLRNKDRGYETSDIYYFELNSPKLQDKADILKNELEALPGVKRASATSRMMGNVYGKWFIKTESMDQKSDVILLNADEDLIPALELEIMEGRNFREDGSDKDGIILNEKAAQKYGLTNVEGQKVQIIDQFEYSLIGIVKDFNYASLHNRPEPLAITYPTSPRWNRFMAVRVAGGDKQKSLHSIEEKVREMDAGATIQFVNLKSFLKRQYCQ
ncbi:MAG: FtsX-like permease family protein [Bacteroidales bacterium]|nr:FtsX-like permease family protein [Bacteroidales bacterium]